MNLHVAMMHVGVALTRALQPDGSCRAVAVTAEEAEAMGKVLHELLNMRKRYMPLLAADRPEEA